MPTAQQGLLGLKAPPCIDNANCYMIPPRGGITLIQAAGWRSLRAQAHHLHIALIQGMVDNSS